MKRISIEGNWCTGKTFYLKFFEQHGYHVHYNDQIDHSELTQKYQSDMKRYSLAYNLQQLHNYIHTPHETGGIHIFEGSPYTLKKVYCDLLYEKNCFDADEYRIYNIYSDTLGWTPDVIIYLYCDPNVCYERNIKRKCLYSPNIEYLKDIHFKYEITCDEVNCSIPIYKINAQENSNSVIRNLTDIITHLSM